MRRGIFSKVVSSTLLAASVSLLAGPMAFAGPGDVNSTNDGQTIQGGTYFNTEGSRTTFMNSNGGGLWLHSGQDVRGLESSISKVPTGNGGTLLFSAPGNTIRLDGNIDVSALRSGSGNYLGNGGKVFIDSALLYQNGNIFANGVNGGLIQMDVGAAVISPTARITSLGVGGNGGAISMNASGPVDIQRGAIIDTSGKVIGTFDTNIINIEGSLVNNEGIVRANGLIVTDFKPDNGDAQVVANNPSLLNKPAPGTISGGTGTGEVMGPQTFVVPPPTANRGGTVRLVATGQTPSSANVISQSQVLSAGEKTDLQNRLDSLARNEGNIVNNNLIETRGANGQDGGTILLAAAHDINNFGTIAANGGNGTTQGNGNGNNGGSGGTIAMAAMNRIVTHGFVEALGGSGGNAGSVTANTGNAGPDSVTATATPGQGGNGGLIAFSYQSMENKGKIRVNAGDGGFGANAAILHSVTTTGADDAHAEAHAVAGNGGTGGHGGLIVFSGPTNPSGGGLVQANGGRGGRGGNAVADARAIAKGTGHASVVTDPVRGQGGVGGATGAVAAPNPSSFIGDQTYLAQAGGLGNSGSQQHLRVTHENGQTTVNNSFEGGSPGTALTGPHRAIIATRKNELLVNAGNALLFSRAGGVGNDRTQLTQRLTDSRLRTVLDPDSATSGSLDVAGLSANFMLASTGPLALQTDLNNSNIDPKFVNLGTLTIVNNGQVTNNDHWAPGVHVLGPGFHDVTFGLGGGHTSVLSSGNIVNNGFFLTRGLWSAGSNDFAAGGDFTNNFDIYNIAFNKHVATGFTPTSGYVSSHGGSGIFKAAGTLMNNGKINSNKIFLDIHPGLRGDPQQEWVFFMNDAQIGATLQFWAGGNIINTPNGIISADALTYRQTTMGAANNPTNALGGTVILGAHGTVTNDGQITANGDALIGSKAHRSADMTTGVTPVDSEDGEILVP